MFGLRVVHALHEVVEQALALGDTALGASAARDCEHVAPADTLEPCLDLLEIGLDLLSLGGGQVPAKDLELDLALELRLALLDDLLVLLGAQRVPLALQPIAVLPAHVREDEAVDDPALIANSL